MTEDMPQTLVDAVCYFADLDRCREFMRAVKWPDGKVTCPACNSDNCGEIATRKMLKCNDCDYQFSERVGTVFSARLPLSHWFTATWCIAVGDCVSSQKLADALGIPQKTAWRILDYLRTARTLTHLSV